MRTLIVSNTKEVVLLDDEDFDRISKFSWCKTGTTGIRIDRKYNVKTDSNLYVDGKKTISIPLANEIMKKENVIYDHKDRNPLNFQKYNLREVTMQQNTWNRSRVAGSSSKYKGVCWYEKSKKWMARITFNGKRYLLGNFENENMAALAYDLAAQKLFGEFAVLNVLTK